VPYEIRAIRPDELDRLLLADQRGFGGSPASPDASRSWAEAELDRTRVAFEDDEIVGVSRNYSFELTVPGGALVPAAAVSWVAVLPTHRRRGVLTQMIEALHEDARTRGEPIAMLTASESVIYGRFGYGVATWRLGLSAERARIEFIDPDAAGRMRMLTREEAEKVLPELYDRTRLLRGGMVSRPSFWWPQVFWDFMGGHGKKAFFTAVHTDASGSDDGFVAYEISDDWNRGLPDRRLLVWDMQAVDGNARAALWKYVFGVDLIDKIVATNSPIDDPLRRLVTDGRRVQVDFVNDGLWIAPLDPAPLLAARRYTIEHAFVIEVHAPDGTSRRFALEGGPDGAQCVPSSASPDLVCSTATLGACALGGNRWSELAETGLVDAVGAEALARADAMFMSTPEPALLSGF
jgi:predicted acetyltransferase